MFSFADDTMMEEDEEKLTVNPWTCESIYTFSYFCCPECNGKWHGKQDFVNHAFHKHPKAIEQLTGISDGSLDDIDLPESEKKEDFDIKSEEYDIEISNDKAILIPNDKCDLNIHADELLPAKNEPDVKAEEELDLDYDPPDDIGIPGDSDPEDEEDQPIAKRLKLEAFKCSMCDYCAKSPKQLIAHVKKTHNNSKTVTCSYCSDEFKNFQQLKLHVFKEHKGANKQEKCLCTLCGKTLIGRSNLKKHEREKHGIDNAKFIRKDRVIKIECSKCDAKFDSVQDLNEHTIICSGESLKFPCISCSLKWANGPVLNMHLKIDHKMPEIHTCDKCGKCLKKKVSLLSHVKVDHDNIKDHVCHLCGRGFARQQGLQFHIKRVHENTGKHFCDRCPFKAITRPELEIHINEIHTKAIKFHCDQCSFYCYRKGGLAAHVKNVHLKLRPHRCDTCGQAFVRRKELEKHKEWANHT